MVDLQATIENVGGCRKCGGRKVNVYRVKVELDACLSFRCAGCESELVWVCEGRACSFCDEPALFFLEPTKVYRCLDCFWEWFVAWVRNTRAAENTPGEWWGPVKWEGV